MVVERQASFDVLNFTASRLLGFGCLLMLIVGCSNDGDTQGFAASELAQNGDEIDEIKVDVMDFVNNSGIEPTFPQVWIFDKTGALISTERGYSSDRPLNIEADKQATVAADVAKLEQYLETKGVRFERWQRCGTDYCVVQLIPDASLGECPPCGMMESRLDAYFSARGFTSTHYSVLLAK